MANQRYTPEQQAKYAENKRLMDAFIADAKTKIDISDVLKGEFGYTLWEDDPSHKNDRKSTASAKVYFKRTVDGTESFTEVVTVRRNQANGEYYYNNLQNAHDKGNIFSLAQKRLGMDFKEGQAVVRKWFDRYGSGRAVDAANIQPSKPETKAKDAVTYFKVRELYNTSFLQKRGVDDATTKHGNFKGKIFNTLRYIDVESNRVYDNNIAFPYFSSGSEAPVAVEVKNVGLSKFLSGSMARKGLWVSNLPISGKIQNLVLVENPINALSIHQLAKDGHPSLAGLDGKDNLFIATGGTYTKEKLNDIQYLVDTYRPEKLILSNDRANSGLRYDINLIGGLERLSGNPNNDNLKAEHNLSGKYSSLSITFNDATANAAIDKLKPLADRFNMAFDKETFETRLSQSGDYSAKLEVTYYNAYENNLFALRMLEEKKGFGQAVEICKPKAYDRNGGIVTDWNDLLMDAKDIDKESVSRKALDQIDEVPKEAAQSIVDMRGVGEKINIRDVRSGVYESDSIPVKLPDFSDKVDEYNKRHEDYYMFGGPQHTGDPVFSEEDLKQIPDIIDGRQLTKEDKINLVTEGLEYQPQGLGYFVDGNGHIERHQLVSIARGDGETDVESRVTTLTLDRVRFLASGKEIGPQAAKGKASGLAGNVVQAAPATTDVKHQEAQEAEKRVEQGKQGDLQKGDDTQKAGANPHEVGGLTYEQFKNRLLDEKNEVLKGDYSVNVEKAFYDWQAEEIKNFDRKAEEQKLELKPHQKQEMAVFINQSIEKGSLGESVLDNDIKSRYLGGNVGAHNQNIGHLDERELIDTQGPQAIHKRDAAHDDNKTHVFNNLLESNENQVLNKWQGFENDNNIGR